MAAKYLQNKFKKCVFNNLGKWLHISTVMASKKIYIYIYICEHNQKWTPYLFQNDVALHSEPYWKQENGAADINVLVLH